jgi:hypothetical protein
MGGWLFCFKCDELFHTHSGGAYIDDQTYCENCASQIEAFWLSRKEEE